MNDLTLNQLEAVHGGVVSRTSTGRIVVDLPPNSGIRNVAPLIREFLVNETSEAEVRAGEQAAIARQNAAIRNAQRVTAPFGGLLRFGFFSGLSRRRR